MSSAVFDKSLECPFLGFRSRPTVAVQGCCCTRACSPPVIG